MKKILFSLIALVLGVSSFHSVNAEDMEENYEIQTQMFMTYQIFKNATISKLCKQEVYTKSFTEFVSESTNPSTTSQGKTMCPKLSKLVDKESKTFGKRVDKNFSNENVDVVKVITKEIKSIEKKILKTSNISKKSSLEVYKILIQSFIFTFMIDEEYQSLLSKSATEQSSLCLGQVSDLKTCAAIRTYIAGTE